MSVKRKDLSACIGCGSCAKICPMDVMRIDEAAGKSVIAYVSQCMTCGQCWLNCPTESIVIQSESATFGLNAAR
ncbi:4Fe-4S binding protein [Adlercreutzia sp. R25]|uniref:4Fe-4S dicluster domain-containing protein n=1 Tax=Adlercreutzia shanghongiae TaxID=3111773 RepID=UPI002DC03E7B|nr:4Fe-4S binding protein [Adlercreutzia sp. R25]MEC4272686.1 4Fe-4S binding protein [Adlercreutzia sp. R25]